MEKISVEKPLYEAMQLLIIDAVKKLVKAKMVDARAADIVAQYISGSLSWTGLSRKYNISPDRPAQIFEQVLLKIPTLVKAPELFGLGLKARTLNRLVDGNLCTIDDLLKSIKDENLHLTHNLGKGMISEVYIALRNKGWVFKEYTF